MDVTLIFSQVSPEDNSSSFIHCFHQVPSRYNHAATDSYGGICLFGVRKDMVFQEREMMNRQVDQTGKILRGTPGVFQAKFIAYK